MVKWGARKLPQQEPELARDQIQGDRGSQQDAADCVALDSGEFLLILADGIGGGPGGDIASQIAVDWFRDGYTSETTLQTRDRLMNGLEVANNRIRLTCDENPALSGMGTTLVGVAIKGNSLDWVSVGDSPLWLVREGELVRLNADHSYGGLLKLKAEKGEISHEEAAQSPHRNVLFSAVLGEDLSTVDLSGESVSLRSGDVVIVASDGVETCSDEEIVQLATDGAPAAADIASAVLAAVQGYNKPGQDNATLVVYRN